MSTSLAKHFLDFCRTKDPDEVYDYTNSDICAWAQFCECAGIQWNETFPPQGLINSAVWAEFEPEDWLHPEEEVWTFGKLTDRLERGLARRKDKVGPDDSGG